MKNLLLLLSILALSACENTPQRYGISVDNDTALKAFEGSKINVESFTNSSEFNINCRGIYGHITLPDNLTFEGYIQEALVEELKVAGLFDSKEAKIVLSGVVEKLEFSTLTSLTGGGSWDIGLRVNSSNGKSTYVSEHYEFDASVQVWAACAQTANAYLPAVQNILNKLITSQDFKSLITPVIETEQQQARIVDSHQTTHIQTIKEKLSELKQLKDAGLISNDIYLERQRAILENR